MRYFQTVLAVAAVSLFAVSANAGVIVSPVTASASSEFSASFDIGNTIDQSGLSAGFVSGVDDFDTYIGLNPTHTLVASDNEWFTAEGVTTATVIFDLGAIVQVARMALWNEEFSGFGSAAVSTSADGIAFSLLTTINPVDNPLNFDYAAQVFNTAFTGRYVQLDMSGCPQPSNGGHDGCGMGEVAFDVVGAAVPVPASILLLGSGVLALSGYASRRK